MSGPPSSVPPSSWDDERIHAFVDGELDAAQAAQLERDSHGDAALAARIAQQRELRARLHRQFDPVLEEAIPARLQDALNARSSGGNVTPIGVGTGAARASRGRWSMREWGAIAATLVLGVLTGSWLTGPEAELPVATREGQLVAIGPLDTALSAQVSTGTATGDAAQIGISVRTATGEYCRTFVLPTRAGGLACRRQGQWTVDILSGPAAQEAGGVYRQAASSVSPAVITALERAGAGEPLSDEQERALIQSGWDPAP